MLILGDSSNVVAGVFAQYGGQYIQYALQQPRLWSIAWLTRWKIIDALLMLTFRFGPGVYPFLSSLVQAAYMWFTNICDQSMHWLSRMESQTLSRYCWQTYFEWGRECVTFAFAYTCGLYLIFECLHLIATPTTQDARPIVMDVPMTLIFKIGQRVCLSCYWI
jgi:hypothetical protein